MAVPKRKTSKQRKRSRRAHLKLSTPNMQFDVASGEYRLSHHVSPSGMYNGEKVIDKSKEA